MRVNVSAWEQGLKPVKGVESLLHKRDVRRALWMGVRVVEFQQISRFDQKPIKDKPKLPGILYHTQRAGRHPSGNGWHRYFAELLPIDLAEVPIDQDILSTALGVAALLEAEARAVYLSEAFPDKEVTVTLPSSVFSPDIRVASGYRDSAISPEQLAEAHDIAMRRNIPIPMPFPRT